MTQNNNLVIKNYTIEKRVYEDVSFFQKWFRNMEPKWSKWEPIYSFDVLSNASSMFKKLNELSSLKRVKIEYRLIKNK